MVLDRRPVGAVDGLPGQGYVRLDDDAGAATGPWTALTPLTTAAAASAAVAAPTRAV
ncbi:hypothetical protein [Kitasatospora purpeofusca]|uniref:hypothetical protein n=1 Tax=Kitasatospora purpeofusca TaxID=67352 RepID=UPI0036481B3F